MRLYFEAPRLLRTHPYHSRSEVEVRSNTEKLRSPLVCNDGMTIAKENDLKHPTENLGAQIIRQAAERTDAVVDGTSTVTMLAHAIFAEAVRNVAAWWCASRWRTPPPQPLYSC